MIYLDYNATAPLRPEVKSAMAEYADDASYNPSSVHAAGRKAKRLLEESREAVASAVSCFSNEVIFTASGTEANNMALRGFGDMPRLVGATEHASVIATAKRVGGDTLPVDRLGRIDLDVLESKLKALGRPALVSVMAANNETGVQQSMAKIAEIVRAYDGLLHSDAVQLLGKAPVDMGLMGADMLTICAHKMGGPVGVGALILRNDLPIKPIIYGGNQELGRRPGTENVLAALGFAKALEVAQSDDWMPRVKQAMDDAKHAIASAFPQAVGAGEGAGRLPHVSSFMTPEINSETQLMHLDLAGVCVSAGSACSSGRIAPSHVLKAMGYPDSMAGCAIRVSAGWNTKPEDLALFTESWLEMAERLLKKAA